MQRIVETIDNKLTIIIKIIESVMYECSNNGIIIDPAPTYMIGKKTFVTYILIGRPVICFNNIMRAILTEAFTTINIQYVATGKDPKLKKIHVKKNSKDPIDVIVIEYFRKFPVAIHAVNPELPIQSKTPNTKESWAKIMVYSGKSPNHSFRIGFISNIMGMAKINNIKHENLAPLHTNEYIE